MGDEFIIGGRRYHCAGLWSLSFSNRGEVPSWGAGDEFDSRCSVNPVRHIHDTAAALHWYEHAARLGSEWARTRIADLRAAGEESQLNAFRGGNALN